MKWTESDFLLSIKLVKKGKDYEEIGKILNRSTSSVRNKLIKSGYNKNQFTIKKEIVKCLNCDVKFEKRKRKRERKFCSKSCSVTYNNKLRTINKINDNQNIKKCSEIPLNIKNCLNCDESIKSRNKYCNNKCQREYQKKKIFEKIEQGYLNLDTRHYKKYLIEKYGNKCMECGWSEVNEYTGNVPIELEHKDGNSKNNNLNNLELLCPNCHSLTPTYKGANRGNGRSKRMKRYYEGRSY